MNTSDFRFDLPPELVAQHPSERRGEDRLLVLRRESGAVEHKAVSELPSLVPDGAVMVFNDSRVRKARIYAKSVTGAVVEFLFTRRVAPGSWETVCSKMARQKNGKTFEFPEGVRGTIVSGDRDTRIVRLEEDPGEDWFERNGHVPLPPYIKRQDAPEDESRYQTVYATDPGSVAAPTAGLHFTNELLEALDRRGIERVTVTLHVGLGTFLPVRVERIEEHRMHSERYFVPEKTREAVIRAKREGRRVIAVGTTSVRTLESSWDGSCFSRPEGSTDIFIRPGHEFTAVDGIFTNFHTPESTLLMLVCAFAGTETLLSAYRKAVEARYRFFSYGDAMLIL